MFNKSVLIVEQVSLHTAVYPALIIVYLDIVMIDHHTVAPLCPEQRQGTLAVTIIAAQCVQWDDSGVICIPQRANQHTVNRKPLCHHGVNAYLGAKGIFP